MRGVPRAHALDHHADRRRSPIDYAPSETGNVLVLQPTGLSELLSVVLSGNALELARARGMQLRLSHFASCPDADEFRAAR